MDVVGGVLLADGTECKVLTGIDDHSRFVVCAGRDAPSDQPGRVRALRRGDGAVTGSPRRSSPTTARSSPAGSGPRTPRCCSTGSAARTASITCSPRPRSPTTTGKIERFHRTLRTEFLTGRVFDDLPSRPGRARPVGRELQHRATALGARTWPRPPSRFVAADPGRAAGHLGGAARERSGDDWISRKVAANGVISVAWQQISCGKHRAGRRVDIHLDGPTMQIWDGEELLKTVLRDEPEGGQEEARRQGELSAATMTTRCNGSGGAIPSRIRRASTAPPVFPQVTLTSPRRASASDGPCELPRLPVCGEPFRPGASREGAS